MKTQKGVIEKLYLLIIGQRVVEMIPILVGKVATTDWYKFVETERKALNELQDKLSKLTLDVESQATVMLIEQKQLWTNLEEITRFLWMSHDDLLTYSEVIAGHQARIIVWKEQLESILLLLESEQLIGRVRS